MGRDWHAWHREYDDPTSSLARRLVVVRDYLRRALRDGGTRLISMCAGDGRDVLPVLADVAPHAKALLVELDPALAAAARTKASRLGLPGVRVVTGDAGVVDAYLDHLPADIVSACGVFGNVSTAAVRHTITTLPALLAADGIVIWTRGRDDAGDDPAQPVRAWLAAAGFREVAFTAPVDARFRVGMHRLDRTPDAPPVPGTVLFRFG